MAESARGGLSLCVRISLCSCVGYVWAACSADSRSAGRPGRRQKRRCSPGAHGASRHKDAASAAGTLAAPAAATLGPRGRSDCAGAPLSVVFRGSRVKPRRRLHGNAREVVEVERPGVSRGPGCRAAEPMREASPSTGSLPAAARIGCQSNTCSGMGEQGSAPHSLLRFRL